MFKSCLENWISSWASNSSGVDKAISLELKTTLNHDVMLVMLRWKKVPFAKKTCIRGEDTGENNLPIARVPSRITGKKTKRSK